MKTLQQSLNQEEPLNWFPEVVIRIAILDMNNGARNVGIRNIDRIVANFSHRVRMIHSQIQIQVDHFHVRDRSEIPDTSYDLYISSGGPGSPMDDTGAEWELRFFRLLDDLMRHNQGGHGKKFFFGICHSFQLMVKKFDIGRISKREHRKLGIVPNLKTDEGKSDPLFDGLGDRFFAFDNRDWQVTEPDLQKFKASGFELLAMEEPEPGSGRAVTGIRYTDEIESVQFHPEAERDGILMRFTDPDEKEDIVRLLGPEKYDELIDSLHNPNALLRTYKAVLPGFLFRSYNRLMAAQGMPVVARDLLDIPAFRGLSPNGGPSLNN